MSACSFWSYWPIQWKENFSNLWCFSKLKWSDFVICITWNYGKKINFSIILRQPVCILKPYFIFEMTVCNTCEPLSWLETEAIAYHIVPPKLIFILKINANTISRVEWKHRAHKIYHRNIYFTYMHKHCCRMPTEWIKNKNFIYLSRYLPNPVLFPHILWGFTIKNCRHQLS